MVANEQSSKANTEQEITLQTASNNMASEIYFLRRLSVITIILIYCLASSFCMQQREPALCTSAECWDRDNDDGRILSRKRRSLTFPEGSSLQLGMTTKNQN